MYSPLLFTTSSHLSTNSSMLFCQKSLGLVSKSLLNQFLRSFSLSKVTPHMIQQRAERIVMRGCKVWRIWQMLKDLPFKLLECDFDNLCNMRPDVVVKKYGLALSMGSFPSNSLIHVM